VSTSCPQASACFNDPVCISGILCGATSCTGLQSSQALQCWVDCFNGDTNVAFTALEAATCLADTCQVPCQGIGVGL
jgi:hypothetical protein